MSATETAIEHLKLVGGSLCLDFINTVNDRDSERPEDSLASYAELVAWSRHIGITSDAEAGRLLTEAARHPSETGAALVAALTLREALYRIFLATMTGKAPNASDLAAFNAARAQALAHSEIAPAADGFAWRWAGDARQLGRMLWPLACSAEELLLSPDLKRLKQCSGPDCGWLFLDTSKNHTRRWCAMEDCGNRAKARSHYQRKRQNTQAGR